jgi:DNA repair exonuclease SbcCD ATPase subunit
MMALPPPDPRPDPPALPAAPPAPVGVRFDVRLGTGRVAAHAMTADEFLVGGAAGCDLRLPGANLPPVVCQFLRSPDALRFRRLAPAVPVFLNGTPIAGPDPVPVAGGDRVTVGPAEITVHVPPATYLTPRLVPVAEPDDSSLDHRLSAIRTEAAELDRRKAAVAEHEARLLRFQEELAELRQALVLQYEEQQKTAATPPVGIPLPDVEEAVARRRAELEAEYRSRFAELDAESARRRSADEAASADRLRQIEEEIARRRLQFEADVRDTEPRLAELELRRRQVEQAEQALARERQAVESLRDEVARERASNPTADREAELARREEQLRAGQEQYAADLARLDRWQGSLDTRQQELDRRAAEVDQRFAQLRTDTGELEEQVRLAADEQERLAAEAGRLDRLRVDLEGRDAALAQRSARLEAQQATLAVLRAKLDRQQEEAQQEAAQLAADRERQEVARRELDARLGEAEQLRVDLGTVRADHESQTRSLIEQHSLLAATLADIQRQKDALAAEEERQRQKDQELDARSAEIAEQAAVLKAQAVHVIELRERLEADRHAVRDREGTLSEAEAARQALQEQLRRRAEELTSRARQNNDLSRALAEDRAGLERLRAEANDDRMRAAEQLAAARRELESRASDLERQAAALADREAALARQVGRLKEVGQAVAAERKGLADARRAWEADLRDTEEFRAKVAEQMAELRRQAPELETGAHAALEKLAAARDVLRGHLAELHDYARQTREELDAARGQLRAEADALRERKQELEHARSEHRLAVAGFRQQLVEWQAKVAELKHAMAQSESRLEQRQAEVEAAVRQVDETTKELARQEAELRQERRVVAEKRSEMERHLADMREWYKKKLRELAAGRPVDESDMPVLESSPPAPRAEDEGRSLSERTTLEDLDPGDRHLGELLRSRGLVDAETLHALWAEAARQRRTLRQVLLASGVVTLYQLALIEAGNLDALMLGRLRVVDRVRATPRETVYRVFDPARQAVGLLRHLAEAEAQDPARPDEFRRRFAAAAAAAHPNLANTLEVLEVNGRPAALQEWVAGLPSPDWPAAAAVPGVWVRLLAEAARGVNHAHRAGLVHGRLGPESFVLTADGAVKVLGFGEPPWLAGAAAGFDPPPAADLRALGRVAFAWAQPGGKKRAARAKPFPPALAAVVRRLESGAEPPMADVVAFDRPYADAAELIRDLSRLAEDYPPPAGTWEKLLAHVAEAVSGSPPLRESA